MRAFSKRALHEGFTRGLYTRFFFPHDTHEAYETDEAPPRPPEAHETHEAHEALWWCHPSIKDRLQSSSIPQNSCQCLIRCPLLHSHKKEAFCVQQKRKLKCPHFRTKLRVPLFWLFSCLKTVVHRRIQTLMLINAEFECHFKSIYW